MGNIFTTTGCSISHHNLKQSDGDMFIQKVNIIFPGHGVNEHGICQNTCDILDIVAAACIGQLYFNTATFLPTFEQFKLGAS